MVRKTRLGVVLSLVLTVILAAAWATRVAAEEKPWWPFPVMEFSTGKAHVVDYVPLQEKAAKKWNLVALLPHMKDQCWLYANYGLVSEARRLGVKLTIFDAGGYDNLNRQLSQYDDAMAMGADAILLGVISETGMNKKINEGKAKGIINVTFQNPVFEAPVDVAVQNDMQVMGWAAADAVIDYFKDKEKVRTVILPGPAGSGWAEGTSQYFRERCEAKVPGKFVILEEKYGDTGKSVQLKLVEDAFQSYDNIDLLYGNTPMAEVAVNVVEEAGMVGKTYIMGSYESKDLVPFIEQGKVLGMGGEFNVAIAQVAVDAAVRILEGKPTGYGKVLTPLVSGITVVNVDKINIGWAFAPPDYKPVYTVD
jgi:protein TorT